MTNILSTTETLKIQQIMPADVPQNDYQVTWLRNETVSEIVSKKQEI